MGGGGGKIGLTLASLQLSSIFWTDHSTTDYSIASRNHPLRVFVALCKDKEDVVGT